MKLGRGLNSRSRWFTGHIVYNSVDTLDFVGDPRGDLAEYLGWEDEPAQRFFFMNDAFTKVVMTLRNSPVGGHEVLSLHSSKSDNLQPNESISSRL